MGYREKASNASLDDPQANAGGSNWTKYARDLAAAGYYNGKKNGYAWCDVFVDWCIFKAYGAVEGQRIQCQTGDLGAACIYSMQYFQQQCRFDSILQPGDQVFFYGGGTIGQTGIVTDVSDSSITVVEGNSSDRVQELTYSRSDSRIAGYGHPRYDLAASKTSYVAEKPAATAAEIPANKEGEPSLDKTPVPALQYCTVKLPLLKQEDTGTAVESAKLLLIHCGYNCGGRKILGCETPDGDFGPAAKRSVKAFQAEHNLESDGEIGTETWAAFIIE